MVAMTFFVSKILTLLMCIVMFFNTFAFDTSSSIQEKFDVDIEYTFDNDIAGSAGGTVVLTAAKDGEYELFWGNEDEEKLSTKVGLYRAYYSEFLTLETENLTAEATVQEFTAIPQGAECILIYKDRVLAGVEEIPEYKLAEEETAVYNFGALSDVHFGRYYYTLGDDSTMHFPNALNFFEKVGVSLVAMSGDLSNEGEERSFIKFNKIASKYDFPVYTCTGNHDVHSEATEGAWQKYINTGVYGEEKNDGVVEVAENELDFVYAPENTYGDVFIFLCQYQWSYGNAETSRLVTDEQLDWLESQLETYKDTTVYLFFHTFFASPDGDYAMTEGNIENSQGVYYDLVYSYGAPDEVRFRQLLQDYKDNLIVFNGHSHWQFEMQKYNSLLNITDYDGTYATLVHISSVSSPRSVEDDSDEKKENDLLSSEGYLVTVYEDKIVLTGVDFLRGEFLAYATYVIEK